MEKPGGAIPLLRGTRKNPHESKEAPKRSPGLGFSSFFFYFKSRTLFGSRMKEMDRLLLRIRFLNTLNNICRNYK